MLLPQAAGTKIYFKSRCCAILIYIMYDCQTSKRVHEVVEEGPDLVVVKHNEAPLCVDVVRRPCSPMCEHSLNLKFADLNII